MHGMHRTDFKRRTNGSDHTNTGIEQKPLSAGEHIVGYLPTERVTLLACQEGGAFDGDPLRENDPITNFESSLCHEPVTRDFTQHLANHDRPVEASGNLSMSTADGYSEGLSGVVHVLHDSVDKCLSGVVLGQEQHNRKPPRSGTHNRDIVGVDMHGIPADAICGKGDWVGCDDETTVGKRNY